jgi:hypothetical protein
VSSRPVVLAKALGVVALSLAPVTLSLAPAGADGVTTWTNSPGQGPRGTTIDVSSGPDGGCFWRVPIDVENFKDFTGTSVQIALRRLQVTIPLGQVAVAADTTWRGAVTIAADVNAPPATYELVARCIVDNPELPGVRTFEYDPRRFTITTPPAPPPPTPPPPPTTPPPPATPDPVGTPANRGATPSVQVLGAVADRRTGLTTVTGGTLVATGAPTGALLAAGGLALLLGTLGVGWSRVGQQGRRPGDLRAAGGSGA